MQTTHSFKKRLSSAFLAFAMCLSMVPAVTQQVSAVDDVTVNVVNSTGGTTTTVEAGTTVTLNANVVGFDGATGVTNYSWPSDPTVTAGTITDGTKTMIQRTFSVNTTGLTAGTVITVSVPYNFQVNSTDWTFLTGTHTITIAGSTTPDPDPDPDPDDSLNLPDSLQLSMAITPNKLYRSDLGDTAVYLGGTVGLAATFGNDRDDVNYSNALKTAVWSVDQIGVFTLYPGVGSSIVATSVGGVMDEATITVSIPGTDLTYSQKFQTVLEAKPIFGMEVSSGTATVSVGNRAYATVTVGFGNRYSVEEDDADKEAEKYAHLLKWEIPSESQSGVSLSTDSTTQYPEKVYFNTLIPGVFVVNAYLDLTENDKMDANEPQVALTINVEGILLSHTSLDLNKYEVSDVVTATAPAGVNLYWEADTPSIATITHVDGNDRQVQFTGNEPGTTTVTVRGSSFSATLTVSVSEYAADPIITTWEVNTTKPLYFSELVDKIQAQCLDVYDEELASISGINATPGEGIVYNGYKNNENPGMGVGTNQAYFVDGTPSIDALVFVPASLFTGTKAIIEYTAVSSEGRSYKAEIHVMLTELTDVEMVTSAQKPITLESSAFSAICALRMGQPLDYIVFSLPDPNKALLYFDYKDSASFDHQIANGEEIVLNHISRTTVVPSPGYSGTLLIPYVATTNTGTTYTGQLTIEVEPYGDDGPVVYNTMMGQHVTFDATSFNTNCLAVNFQNLNSVEFMLPDPSVGVLYEQYITEYNYRKEVTEDTRYYAYSRSPYIGDVSFVPAEGYSGSAAVDFIGYDTVGNSYKGTVEINVTTYEEGDVNYNAISGGFAAFHDGDFNKVSQSITGSDLDYITFDLLPTANQGSLQYQQTINDGGTAVVAKEKYYYNGSPSIDDLSFQVASGFTGVARIVFQGYAVSGAYFTGVATVMVGNQIQGVINYSIGSNELAQMQVGDFEHVSVERTGATLSHIRFQLPASSVGTLYYNYESTSSMGSVVQETTNYYSSAESFLSKVYFLPANGYSGTVQINFTGWSNNGQEFYGVVIISVEEGSGSMTYSVPHGEHVYLKANDISAYCEEETGAALNYILISMPTTAQGKLYRNYNPSDATHSTANSTTKYFRDQASYIDQLAFIPTDGFYGIVELDFKATTVEGSTVEGTVTIRVMAAEANSAVSYTTTFNPVQFDVNHINAVWTGSSVSHIVFHKVPTVEEGKLYYENNLNSFATVETPYYASGSPNISEMIFAPRGGFRGVVVLPYTATTTQGSNFSGEIKITVTTSVTSVYFNDMASYSWAATAADYLRIAGVTGGVGDNSYGPGQSITRGDFALMLVKAFRLPTTSADSFADVPESAYYYQAVHTLRGLGVAGGSYNQFNPQSAITRQDAMVMLAAAMTAADKLVVGNESNMALTVYNDYDKVADYAKAALAAMTAAGMIAGDNEGNLNPTKNMNRAEMAVVLHNSMTY